MHFSFVNFFTDFVIFQVVKWMFLIFHDFQFSCHIPRSTEHISKFSTFSVFLTIIHVLKCVFLIFRDFQYSRHIPGPSVGISHFSCFLVISLFFKSSSGSFSFSIIFSFLAIFLVLQCTFLNIPPFSLFFAIFHVVKCVFLIFRDFQFSCHTQGPTVCISHFSRLSVISSFFKSSSGCFSFSLFFSFLAILHVLPWTFLNFPHFSVFLVIFHVLKCLFLIFRDFHFSRHFPGPTVCISHFSRFSVISSFFKSSSGNFSFSMIFSFLPYSTSYSGHF